MHQQHQAEGEQQHPEATAALTGLPDQQRRGPHQHRPHHRRLRPSAEQKDQQGQGRQGQSQGTPQATTHRQRSTQQHREVKA